MAGFAPVAGLPVAAAGSSGPSPNASAVAGLGLLAFAGEQPAVVPAPASVSVVAGLGVARSGGGAAGVSAGAIVDAVVGRVAITSEAASSSAGGSDPVPLIDGSVIFGGNQTGTISGALTTANANDVIILFVETGTGPPSLITVSDTAGLTWKLRASATIPGSPPNDLIEYYAIAPSALSNDTITVADSGSAPYLSALAFGISGANTAAPFDANASLPATAAGTPPAQLTLSTAAANTLIFTGVTTNVHNAPGTWSAPWTTIKTGSAYLAAGYNTYSTAQTGLSIPVPSDGLSDMQQLIGDAVVAAPAGSGASATAGPGALSVAGAPATVAAAASVAAGGGTLRLAGETPSAGVAVPVVAGLGALTIGGRAAVPSGAASATAGAGAATLGGLLASDSVGGAASATAGIGRLNVSGSVPGERADASAAAGAVAGLLLAGGAGQASIDVVASPGAGTAALAGRAAAETASAIVAAAEASLVIDGLAASEAIGGQVSVVAGPGRVTLGGFVPAGAASAAVAVGVPAGLVIDGRLASESTRTNVAIAAGLGSLGLGGIVPTEAAGAAAVAGPGAIGAPGRSAGESAAAIVPTGQAVLEISAGTDTASAGAAALAGPGALDLGGEAAVERADAAAGSSGAAALVADGRQASAAAQQNSVSAIAGTGALVLFGNLAFWPASAPPSQRIVVMNAMQRKIVMPPGDRKLALAA